MKFVLFLAIILPLESSFSATAAVTKTRSEKQEPVSLSSPVTRLPEIKELVEQKEIQPAIQRAEATKPPAKVNVSDDIPVRFNKADFYFQGALVSSIYYNSTLKDEETDCATSNSANISDSSGSVLMRVCRTTLKTCAMEGVCQIRRKNEVRTFNYHGIKNNRMAFFEFKNGDCVYGFGVQNSCLDHFYTVAADISYHRPGEVIFIPKLVGLVLPNHTKHNGFMVVRDIGDKIVGSNRFDFFSGSYFWKDPENPFFQANLGGSSGQLKYYKVTGTTAQMVLKQRNYPKLP